MRPSPLGLHSAEVFESAAVFLLVVVVAGTLFKQGTFAGFALLCGVAVGGLLALRGAPFPVVILVAPVRTAILRALGVASWALSRPGRRRRAR